MAVIWVVVVVVFGNVLTDARLVAVRVVVIDVKLLAKSVLCWKRSEFVPFDLKESV